MSLDLPYIPITVFDNNLFYYHNVGSDFIIGQNLHCQLPSSTPNYT